MGSGVPISSVNRGKRNDGYGRLLECLEALYNTIVCYTMIIWFVRLYPYYNTPYHSIVLYFIVLCCIVLCSTIVIMIIIIIIIYIYIYISIYLHTHTPYYVALYYIV